MTVSGRALIMMSIVVGLGVALLLLPATWVIVGLYVAGLLGALAFCVTWYPLAFRALAHHDKDVSLIRIFDYAGIQLAILLSFALILRNFAVYGIAVPQDDLSVVGRLMLPLTVDGIIFLRLFKWGRQLWRSRHGSRPDPLRSVDEHDRLSDPRR